MSQNPTVPRVMIASPTPGEVKTIYQRSVMATMNDLGAHGIYAEWDTFDAIGDVTVARNILATRFIEKTSNLTHIFMADADMEWPAPMCREMIGFDKPIVGTGCAKRQLDLGRVEWALKQGCTLREAMLFGMDWVVSMPPDTKTLTVDNGLIGNVVRHGFGAVLIKREVFETMIERGVAQPQDIVTGQTKSAFYNFFTPRPENAGQHHSEDRSFTDKWTKDCGGELFVYAEPAIYHHGDFAYGGSYLEFLKVMTKLHGTTG